MVQVRQPFYSLPRTTQNFSETAVAPPYFTPALAAALTVALTPLHQMIVCNRYGYCYIYILLFSHIPYLVLLFTFIYTQTLHL